AGRGRPVADTAAGRPSSGGVAAAAAAAASRPRSGGAAAAAAPAAARDPAAAASRRQPPGLRRRRRCRRGGRAPLVGRRRRASRGRGAGGAYAARRAEAAASLLPSRTPSAPRGAAGQAAGGCGNPRSEQVPRACCAPAIFYIAMQEQRVQAAATIQRQFRGRRARCQSLREAQELQRRQEAGPPAGGRSRPSAGHGAPVRGRGFALQP
ncbi:unnamed protein product, partial [Prorocentrum cordatum]